MSPTSMAVAVASGSLLAGLDDCCQRGNHKDSQDGEQDDPDERAWHESPRVRLASVRPQTLSSWATCGIVAFAQAGPTMSGRLWVAESKPTCHTGSGRWTRIKDSWVVEQR